MQEITFGTRRFGAAEAVDVSETKPKAMFWLNVGYATDVLDKQGKPLFVSLAQGIPLDTLQPIAASGRDKTFLLFTQARNQLLTDLLEYANQLQPGEAVILPGDGPLQIQIRRVEAEIELEEEDNPFIKHSPFKLTATEVVQEEVQAPTEVVNFGKRVGARKGGRAGTTKP